MGWPEYGRIHAFHNNHTMVQHQKMYFFFFFLPVMKISHLDKGPK